ncbi:hypothetical protein B7494_g6097 [Chlorociboria aeruginascens]|nr:hypothetical protein B7494_g6097 [Chlorociboria aeruginascens]
MRPFLQCLLMQSYVCKVGTREMVTEGPFTFRDLEDAPTSTISATQAPTSVTSIMHFLDETVYAAPRLYPTSFEGYGSQPFIFQDLRGAPTSAISAGQAPTFPSSTINFPDETIYAAPPYSMSSISNFKGYGSQFLASQPNSGFASGSTVYAAPHLFPTNSSTNFERYGFQPLTFQHLGYPLDESLLVTPPTPTTPLGPTPHPTSNDFRHA